MDLTSVEKYGLLVIPTTFVINQSGQVTEILANFNDSIAGRLNKIIQTY